MKWEVILLQNLQEIRNPVLTAFMEAITSMAESLFIVILIAVLYWCIDKKRSLRIGWIVLFSAGINGIVKNIVRMPRPFQKGVTSPIRVQTATSYSFPSGHTQLATTFWGSSMMILKGNFTYIVGTALILLTAFSRLYLGVHWPTDVIGGIIFGVVSLIIGLKLIDEKATITKVHVIGVSIAFIVCTAMPIDADLAKTIGALWGLTFGAYLEQKYIHFIEKETLKNQIIKVIVGFTVTILLYIGMKTLMPKNILTDMIRYSVVLLWVSAGAPYLFKKLFNKNYKH
ncbi:MAG: phosphatase PAP2 family protein [Cellulosilyticaceae bacterium]